MKLLSLFIVISGIANAQCQAAFTYSVSGNNIYLTDASTYSTAINYEWTFYNNCGSELTYFSNPPQWPFTTPYAGDYKVWLHISDGNLCNSTFYDTITVSGTHPPCSASFSNWKDTSIHKMGFYVNAPCYSKKWFWDFGDGNQDTAINLGYAPAVYHNYFTSGTYTVCTKVITQANDTCSFCDTVNIVIPASLNGTIFSDANSNCIKDGGDISLANWMVQAQNTSSLTNYYGVAASNGDYNVQVPAGNYDVSLLPLNNYWNQVCPLLPSSYSVSVNNDDTVLNLNFGMQAAVSCADLTVGIGTANQRRCLKNNFFYIQGSNNGTVPVSNALLKVNFDAKIIPLSSTLPWDSISGTEYFWKLGTMNPGQSVSFTVTDSVSCSAWWGDTLLSYAQILPLAGDCNTLNNYVEDVSVVTGSFDPNEKKAVTTTNKAPIIQGNILQTDTITYTIAFQNTGTDTAFNVTVFDELDPSLTVSSVISGISSHPYTLQILGTNVLKWTFNNILLPDSNVNEPASHGFIKFKVLQKPNNPIGTVISNYAGIVFDYNTSVNTDTVMLIVSTPTAIYESKGENNSISVSPNPTSGVFTIQSSDPSASLRVTAIEIVNLLGEKTYSTQLTQSTQLTINLSDKPNGVYFLQFTTEKGIARKKIVISK
ncbi:MAG: T9SS type A sorting domain-containing protein [Bacteroidetes bacterium]|nr:T9SS type A sorting domain-containing protein [Bacteroidota bacterium]